MKKKFSWYFPPSDDEITSIWENGVLTVDANVLLDLYRYHESTRNSLISNLKGFKGKLWLSNQAAEEFFKNRTKVIISSEKTFKQAKEEVEKLQGNFESTVSQLKGNRIIPAEVADKLVEAITPIVSDAQDKILAAKNEYPEYLKKDPILEELSEMFSDSIGDEFKKEELEGIKKEAKERIENKIPPGYLDQDKDGERPFGDFLLWRQILLHSKNKGTPIIFVTSERKEDWWEKISGKTIGPRPELLREASDFCGQRILIYQTDRFLEYASKRSGGNIDESIVEEIRAVDTIRTETEHAVELIEQDSQTNTAFVHEGVLTLILRKPVKNITGSGLFKPRMDCVPTIVVSLVEAPGNMPEIKIRAGAGTNWNFNLHVISKENGVLLPIGQYKLKYKAICEETDTQIDAAEDDIKI